MVFFKALGFIISVYIFILSPFATAKNQVYIFGGSGDSPHSLNLFTSPFQSAHQLFTERNFKVDGVFDGDHPIDRAEISKTFGHQLPTFTPSHANAVLEKIKNSNYQPGDQVMLIIENHGEPGKELKTHCIVVNGGCWSLDQVEQVKNALKEKKVKMAIIDNSCYSGKTADLADSNTCVITGANATSVGYSSFSQGLYNQQSMAQAQNLEQLFITGLSNDPATTSFPGISTPMGKQLRELEKAINQISDTTESFSPIGGSNVGAVLESIRGNNGYDAQRYSTKCLNETPFDDLLKNSRQILDATTRESLNLIVKDIKEYNSILKNVDDILNKLNATGILPDLNIDGHIVKSRYLNLSNDIDQQLAQEQSVLANCKGEICESYKQNIETLQWLKTDGRREQILEAHPNYQEYNNLVIQKEQLSARLAKLSDTVGFNYRRVAVDLLKQEQHDRSTENACSNFSISDRL